MLVRAHQIETDHPHNPFVAARRQHSPEPAAKMADPREKTSPRREIADAAERPVNVRPGRGGHPVRPSARAYTARRSRRHRSDEHTSELPSLMRTSYAVFRFKQ